MTSIEIKSLGKAVEMQEYTRKIDRTYNNLMFEGTDQIEGEDGKMKWKFSPSSVNAANDYLVGAMFKLEQDEVDMLKKDEYDTLLEKCMKKVNPK